MAKVNLMNILLINDDLFTAGTIIEDIANIEEFAPDIHNIESANSAKDALIKVRNNKFDLLLINISSKTFDACELIQQVKSICQDIKIITITDQNSRDLELKIRKQGVLFYMIKPFKIKILKDILEYISKSKEDLRVEKLQKFHDKLAKL